MLKEGLKEYFREQSQEVAQNLPLVRQSTDVDGIHDLRVGIKKIKSIYELLDHCQDSEKMIDERFQAYHSLFKAAGKIRDLQVEEQLLHKYEKRLKMPFQSFTSKIQQDIEAHTEAMTKEAEKFEHKILENDYQHLLELLQKQDEKKLTKRAKQYAVKRFEKVEKHAKKAHKPKKLHKSRTHMKKGFYVTALLTEYAGLKELEPLTEKASNLASDIGDWHDKHVLLEEVEKYIEEKQGLGNLEPYYFLKENLEKEHRHFIKKGKKKLKKLTKVYEKSVR